MKFLIINYPYLANHLKSTGAYVLTAGPYKECDIFFDSFDLNDLKLNESIDILIVVQSLDKPRLFINLDRFKSKKIFISVDSTINFYWQKYYLKNFDLTLCDQPNISDDFSKLGINSLPFLLAFNDSNVERKEYKREIDLLFVGKRNSKVRGKRENILKLIDESGINIKIIDGVNSTVSERELYNLYRSSKIVLNENLFPSINLRLFEIMGCGALCFTEENTIIENYFEDYNNLVTYNHSNIIYKLKKLLNNDNLRSEIANRGRDLVIRNHRESIRANYIAKIAESIVEVEEKREENNTNTILSSIFLYEKYKDRNFLDIVKSIKPSKPLNYQEFSILQSVGVETEAKEVENDLDFFYKSWLNILKEDFRSETIFKEQKEYNQLLYFSANFLYTKGIKINPGFTNETNNPLLFTAFEFYLKLVDVKKYRESSLKKLISILDEISSYENALYFAEKLLDIDSNKLVYKNLVNRYRKLSYNG